MLALAAKLNKEALGLTSLRSVEHGGTWLQGAPSFAACLFQHLAVNVSALESCVWSQGLSRKSECVHVCTNSDIQFLRDSALGFCSVP